MGDDLLGINEPLQLEPFIHQVGGHSSMLQFNKKTICKPLIPRELKFYQNCPDCLKCYLPEFKGVIEVSFSTDAEGYLGLTTFLPLGYTQSGTNDDHLNIFQEKSDKIKHRIRVCQSGSIQIESDSSDGGKKTFEEQNLVKEQQTSKSLLNPWVLHCHQEQINKIRNHGSSYAEKYILLEDLTSKYEFPCILDIKMGTQPYGDEQSIAKRQGHIAKNASTTSASLGIRICGMQVYHHDAEHYICHNKYYGRGLTVDGFRQALYHFFHDGYELRSDVILQVLVKLEKLYQIVTTLDAFRFFTSSLIIIYNGKKYDKDYKKGRSYIPQCKANRKVQDNGNSNEASHANKNTHLPFDGRNSEWNFSEKNSAVNVLFPDDIQQIDSVEKKIEVVDVRMIDFAHSTMSDSGCQTKHVGPDDGYLFGLKNLISQLKAFQPEQDC